MNCVVFQDYIKLENHKSDNDTSGDSSVAVKRKQRPRHTANSKNPEETAILVNGKRKATTKSSTPTLKFKEKEKLLVKTAKIQMYQPLHGRKMSNLLLARRSKELSNMRSRDFP